MDSAQFKRAIDSVSDQLIDYYANLEERRVAADVAPGYLKKLLPQHAPEEGEEWECIQKDMNSKIMPGMTHWNSPYFMAYFPAPTSFPSILGELYSSMLAVSAFNWDCAPVVTELEVIVMDWLVKMFNLPSCYLSTSDGGGVMQGSTSEAVLSVMVAARERYLAQTTALLSGHEKEVACAQKRLRMVALGSQASHSCTQKAAMVLGIQYRSVPVYEQDGFGMTGAALAAVIQQCLEEGLEPFYLTATLGTTSTCAIDRFEEIAHILKGHQIWVHVDAAFAGAALICEEYQHLTQNFEEFDSFSMSMSKWLLTNIDAVCCFIKNRHDLIDALSITPTYLRSEASDSGEVIDFRHWGVPLSRRFRALKVWFVIRTHGIRGLKAYIRNHIRLGEDFASMIESRPDLFRIEADPAFALTVISIVPRVPTVLRKLLAVKAQASTLNSITKIDKPQNDTQIIEKAATNLNYKSVGCNGVSSVDGEYLNDINGFGNEAIVKKSIACSCLPSVTNGSSPAKGSQNRRCGPALIHDHTNGNGMTDETSDPSSPKYSVKEMAKEKVTELHGDSPGMSSSESEHDEGDNNRNTQSNGTTRTLTNGIHTNGDSNLNGTHGKLSNGVCTNGKIQSNGFATELTNGNVNNHKNGYLKTDQVQKAPSQQNKKTISTREFDDAINAWLTDYANLVTKEVYDLISKRGKIMLTSTVVGDRFVIRIVGANPKTEGRHLRQAFEILVSTAEEVLSNEPAQ